MTKKARSNDPFAAEGVVFGERFYPFADAYFAVEFRAGAPQWDGYPVIQGDAPARIARQVLKEVPRDGFDIDAGHCIVFCRADCAENVIENLEADSAILAYAEMPKAAVRRLAMRGL